MLPHPLHLNVPPFHDSQLGLNASCRPLLGTLGRAIDRALLHRVAEATIKDFLDQTGQAIQSST